VGGASFFNWTTLCVKHCSSYCSIMTLGGTMSQVVDPKRASYGVENATAAVVQLAQTTMRSELGRITLDKTFEERTALNNNIVKSIQYSPPPPGRGHSAPSTCILRVNPHHHRCARAPQVCC